MRITRRLLGTSLILFAASASTHAAAPAGVKDALSEPIGLHKGSQFQLVKGECKDCPTIRQGLWYFRDDVLAVPPRGAPVAGFKPTRDIVGALREWAVTPERGQLALPPLVWLGAPQIFDDAAILPDGATARAADGGTTSLLLVPKIASNLSYWDAKTTEFFAKRPVRMRGTYREEAGKSSFIARTVWPKDFRIDQAQLKASPLAPNETLTQFVQAENGGAASPYSTRLLWERTPGQARQWQDKPVIGVMLNGAQGDDDEAFGGHFAIATGQMGKQGEWSDWIVNNFYNLDSASEKGIIAAPVPMDNYLMDLNSGQQYYRPSYMLVAVLNNARTAAAYQGGVQRVFNHFYRHDFTYKHAGANCAGISLDVFKALGWNIPERGPTSKVKAIGAYAYLSAKDMSLKSGRKIYDYLTEEQVRLYPAVAFDAAGTDLMQLVGASKGGAARTLSDFEKQLQSDVEALVLVRIPQVPSSRVMGSNPVFSFDEFMARTPPNQADWKIVPAGPRPFPAELRDGAAVDDTPSPVPLPVGGIALAGLVGIGALIRRRKKKAA